MVEVRAPLTRPIRVVMFGGGPVLEEGVKQFLVRLEAHPEIELQGAFCQSAGQSLADVWRDLWQRRGWLAVPLLAFQAAGMIGRYVRHPRGQFTSGQQFARLESRIHYVPDVHAEAVLEQVRVLAPDLGLSYGSPILKPALFNIPTFGTLGIHHGKLPQYRGKKTTFWAMYNSEVTADVTIQKVNAGLDTGDIVKQGAVEIGARSLSAVWDELETLGLDLYIEAILEVKDGRARYRPQVGKKGRLYSDPAAGDILAFWWRRAKRRLQTPAEPLSR